jgi:hypothetical protein
MHPDPFPILEKIDQIRAQIQNIDSHLLKTFGMAKTPLSYIIRVDTMVPPNAQDPATDYATVQEEMVAQMPHTHLAY